MKKLENALEYARAINAKTEKEMADLRDACYQDGQELNAVMAAREAPPYTPQKMAELSARQQALESEMEAYLRQIMKPGPKLTDEEAREALRLYQGANEEYQAAYAAACQGFRESMKQAQAYSREAFKLRMAFTSFSADFEKLTGCEVTGLNKPTIQRDTQVEKYAAEEARLNFWQSI